MIGKKFMALVLSGLVAVSMTAPAFAAEASVSSDPAKAEQTVSAAAAKAPLTVTGFSPKVKSTVKVTGKGIYDYPRATADGTFTVKMTVGPSKYAYSHLKIGKKKYTAKYKKSGKKYVSTLNFKIPVSKLEKNVKVSLQKKKTGKWVNMKVKIESTPELVDQFVNNIAVQSQDGHTGEMCRAAGKAWEALTKEEKARFDASAENAGYFSTPTGDASKDKPRNTAPDKKKEILVVSFGTSYNDSRARTIGGIEQALQQEYGKKYSVRRAFTSNIIMNHILARDGEKIDYVTEAMDKAVKAGVKEMIVQPTMLMSGTEYDQMYAVVKKYQKKIRIQIASPLLHSEADRQRTAKAITGQALQEAGFENLEAADQAKTAFVFMGHGTSHEARVTYNKMQETVNGLGYKNVFIGTVEGKPENTALPQVFQAVREAGYTKVVLRPLMVVAGDHANNDMAGDEEGSWKYTFVNGGHFEGEGAPEGGVELGVGFGASNVDCQIDGLGAIPEVQQIYLDHTREAIDRAAEAAAKIPAKVTSLKAKNLKGTKVKVTFGKSAKASKYLVKWKVGKKVYKKTVRSASLTISKGLKKGKTVKVTVYAKNGSGTSKGVSKTLRVDKK